MYRYRKNIICLGSGIADQEESVKIFSSDFYFLLNIFSIVFTTVGACFLLLLFPTSYLTLFSLHFEIHREIPAYYHALWYLAVSSKNF